MQALILAAGLGTRLQPLTNDRPKALVEINGHTLLEINLRHIIAAGTKKCVVNVHHFGDMVIQAVEALAKSLPYVSFDISDERDMLLDTGGAIKHAAPHFSGHEPILVHNVDVVSDVDLKALEQHHLASGNLVTLCVCNRNSSRKLLFDATGNLCGRDANKSRIHDDNGTINDGSHSLAFSGIAIISPELPPLLPPDDHPYPIIDEYLRLSKNHRVGYYLHDANHWMDLGTIERIRLAQQESWIQNIAKL